MGSPVVPLTARLSQNQQRASNKARGMQDSENHGSVTLDTQDIDHDPGYVIYIYNILDREWTVRQPPLFPMLMIPACPKGQPFSFTILPAFVKLPYLKPGGTEYYYKNEDGRKAATSLLNPSAFPGTKWESQIQKWDSPDQMNNNLNAYGVFWSLTKPDETEKLKKEITIFKKRVQSTMDELIREGERLNSMGDKGRPLISPLMHFAMDYQGKQAPWHMASFHMITCPNCGEPVQEGIAYHKNAFGERCIVDYERYEEMLRKQKAMEANLGSGDPTTENEAQSAPAKRGRKTKAA